MCGFGPEERIDNPAHLACMRAFDHNNIAGVNFRLKDFYQRIGLRGVYAPAVGRQMGKHVRHLRAATENQIDIHRIYKSSNIHVQIF